MSTQSPESSGVKKRSAKRAALAQDALIGILLAELQKGGPALAAAAAVKLVKAAGETTTAAAVTGAFELMASQGRAHRHPGTKSGHAYSLQSATELVAQGVSNTLKAGTDHSLASIRASAPKAYVGLVDEEIGRLVREGKLFQLPGTAKTTKFTTQQPPPTPAPQDLVVQGLNAVLQSGTEHTLTALRRVVPKKHQDLVDEEVGRRVREGKLFQLPGKTPKFTTQQPPSTPAPQDLVVQGLNAVLKSGTEHTLTALRRVAPKKHQDLVDEEIGRRVREGKLFQLPGTTRKFSTQRLRPTSVLTASQRKTLETILSKVNPLRARSLGINDILEFLDGSVAPALQSATPSSTAAQALPVQPVAKPKRPPTLPWLLELYRADLPARGGLTSMPIPWTWRRYVAEVQSEGGDPDRAAFERTLMEARSQGRVEITPHERPTALSPEELAAAFREPLGVVLYYWRPIKVQ